MHIFRLGADLSVSVSFPRTAVVMTSLVACLLLRVCASALLLGLISAGCTCKAFLQSLQSSLPVPAATALHGPLQMFFRHVGGVNSDSTPAGGQSVVMNFQGTRFLPTAGFRCMAGTFLPPLAGCPSWFTRRMSLSWGPRHPHLAFADTAQGAQMSQRAVNVWLDDSCSFVSSPFWVFLSFWASRDFLYLFFFFKQFGLVFFKSFNHAFFQCFILETLFMA